jgi:hypothetical protein
VLTCEYCFSHYVAAGVVAFSGYRLLLDDWRGYVIAWLSLVAVANVYMSAYGRLRVETRKERAGAQYIEKHVEHDGTAPPEKVLRCAEEDSDRTGHAYSATS